MSVPSYYFERLKKQVLTTLSEYELKPLKEISDLNHLTQFVNMKVTQLRSLIVWLQPNAYVRFIYDYFDRFGATSQKYIVNTYYMNCDDVSLAKLTKSGIRRSLARYLELMEIYNLVDIQILPFTTPKQTKIYIRPGCTAEQLEQVLKLYKGYEDGYIERMKLKMTYHHESGKKAKQDSKEEAIIDTKTYAETEIDRLRKQREELGLKDIA